MFVLSRRGSSLHSSSVRLLGLDAGDHFELYGVQDHDGTLTLVASGAVRAVDTERVVLKRVILSGYPLRVNKCKATVRFMFFNPDDVRWFKPLELWTRHGRRGRIVEPLGTHGAMKCVFDAPIQQQDAVCVSLFKRIFPKFPSSLSFNDLFD